jgi:membrane associated rhomboid family serine protease
MFGDRNKLVMCQACRGLVEASAKTCPLCGRESVPRRRVFVNEKAGGESFFSLLLLGINVGLFLMMAAVDLTSGTEGVTLMNAPSDYVLRDFGGRSSFYIYHGQWWRFVTPNFLHLGVTHLMFNSISLYYIGPQVEALYGSQKFIFIYLATGILSNIGAFAFGIQGAGASGALFGLIGLMAAYGHRLGGSFGYSIRRQMLIWAGIGFVFGFLMGADNVSHAGGFIAGAALAYVISGEEPTLARSAMVWNIVAIACALVVVGSFAMVAKNYGSSRTHVAVERSYNSVSALEQAFINAYQWTSAGGADPQQLASNLRTAASSVERNSDIDPQLKEISRRLTDLATARAALLDAAKTNPSVITGANSRYDEVDAALKDYLTWWRDKRREFGFD